MISKIKKELQNTKRDNKGAALVMVIIAIAFVGMLVAMILYMAYCNYLMKASDTLAKDNFYSAEYALDVVNAGLQLDVSECMSEAYVKTMNNSNGNTSDVMEAQFKESYLANIEKKLQPKDGSGNPIAGKWNVDHLKSFLTKNSMNVVDTAGLQGVYLAADGDNKLEIAPTRNYITLHNLKVVFTDDRGYVSIIRTDIRIKVPEIGFAQAASKMDIENFSLIANDSLVNENNNSNSVSSVTKGSDTTITGNVFGGYEGVVVADQKRLRFIKDSADAADKTYNLIADSLSVDNANRSAGLHIDESFTTYVDNINVTSSEFVMEGSSFVGDDLTIGGKSSYVEIDGDYKGYGNTLGNADGSSSILINGGDTRIDFSQLDSLLLSGHAYVGASKYDADVDRLAHVYTAADGTTVAASSIDTDKIRDEEAYSDILNDEATKYTGGTATLPKNELDFMMGESISVKANQLLYMVPTECIGYKISTGEQVIAKNPMTYAEYELLTTPVEKKDAAGNTVMNNGQPVMEDVYEAVRLDKLWTKLGGVSYTNDYKAVYRRINGTVLVYLYLDFGVNETMANEFYKAYYEYDKEGINDYVSSYIRNMSWNSGLTTNMTLAGNAFYIDGNGEVVFLEDDISEYEKYKNMLTWQTEYSEAYHALMYSLRADDEGIAAAQQGIEIFDSLVDDSKLAEMHGKAFAAGSVSARIFDGDVVVSDCPSDIRLLVASGDIYMDRDFKGLAIAGGNIYICTGCSSVEYSPSDVIQAMRAKVHDSASGNDIYAYEIFGASGEISYAISGSEVAEDEAVELSDLIVYQNWKKE
ncbi:MAG: hypothetical protein IJZ76_09020 [Lachnospiraceae bacterium]|nr:hypothetical protein [Lachnospiraceae bacterium]